MANAKNPLYIANLKPANEEQFGFSLLKGAVCIEDLKELLESEEMENLKYEYEGLTYFNIKVVQRKKSDNYGRSHFAVVDDFVPDSKKRKVANDNSKAANDNEPKDTTEKTKTEGKSTTGKTGKRGSKKQATTA